MTNRFKPLDKIFPCGAERHSGEVVSASVTLNVFGRDERPVISWKRKAWYVNASVNAWHLHRGLCQELRDANRVKALGLPRSTMRSITRCLATLVMQAYMVNAFSDDQYHDFIVWVPEIDLSAHAWGKLLQDGSYHHRGVMNPDDAIDPFLALSLLYPEMGASLSNERSIFPVCPAKG